MKQKNKEIENLIVEEKTYLNTRTNVLGKTHKSKLNYMYRYKQVLWKSDLCNINYIAKYVQMEINNK